ncbi:MAG: hypothetical protein JWM28_4080, partial [Chitinophagaceae bacterium]|nr:hypothetical protein [Chitinophagaceae bacterium]
QVRLFATSGSPDFIAALYLWLIFYLFINYQKQGLIYLLIIFLGFFSATIKLQTLPVILFALFYYYKLDQNKIHLKIFISIAIGLLVIVPLLFRNVISSGYLLFPSPFPDLFNFDWEVRKDFLIINQEYITSYARANVPFSLDLRSHDYQMNMIEWLPVWWNLRSLADKLILSGIPASVFLLILFHKRIFIKRNNQLIGALVFLASGILFWFIKAPDPRFGFGFLIPFIAIVSYLLIGPGGNKKIVNKQLICASLLLTSTVLLIYSSYRFYNYFSIKNILQPAGISLIPYQEVNCNGITINFPLHNEACGNSPVPCTRIKCDSVVLRGPSFEGGFRIKK